MCSSQSPAMEQVGIDRENPFLPEEILTNIFKRLPVKSLIRFQCVCKHWKNLIKTPSFIADHLDHSTHQNPFLLVQRNREYYPLHLSLIDRELQVLEVQNDPLFDSMLGIWIVDSCNGLLCIEFNNLGKSHSLLLWNPAIREVREVPKAVNIFKGVHFFVGFGFSPIVDDYKIVRIYASANNYLVNQVEVYSLSTGSWKAVEFRNLDGVSLSFNGFNTSGAIFWFGLKLGVVEEDEDDIDVIISFDLATEVFSLIPIPSLATKPYRNGLTMYENQLALLSHTFTENFESSMIDLWVMEEGTSASEERWNWTKKYTSSPYPYLLFPVTMWGNEIACNVSILLGPISETECEWENDEQKIVLFNLTTNKFKMLANISKRGLGYGIFNYVESLVPIGNIHIE